MLLPQGCPPRATQCHAVFEFYVLLSPRPCMQLVFNRHAETTVGVRCKVEVVLRTPHARQRQTERNAPYALQACLRGGLSLTHWQVAPARGTAPSPTPPPSMKAPATPLGKVLGQQRVSSFRIGLYFAEAKLLGQRRPPFLRLLGRPYNRSRVPWPR